MMFSHVNNIILSNQCTTKYVFFIGEQGSVKPVGLAGTRNPELKKHFDNLGLILKWSNATPIKTYGGKGYTCSYCLQQFLVPADLKKHTQETHSKIVGPIVKKSDLRGFHMKLDITDLECVCTKTLDDIEELVDHLCEEHDLYFHTDIKNYIIPIKFYNDELRCYICINKFCSFKMLIKHMNVHFRNFVCNVCDEGFVYSKQLKNHSATHMTGSFKCDSCDKSFDTKQKCRYHIRSVHSMKARNKCVYCGEFFRDYRTKISHQYKVHGVACVFKCTACDRSFISQRGYQTHMQRYHLMERRHPCKYCDMRFYSTSELKCHLAKHNIEVPVFKCDICMKSYKRKTTLRNHLRIHSDDRPYRCEVCSRTFIHKCSWRSHLTSKHGIIQPKVSYCPRRSHTNDLIDDQSVKKQREKKGVELAKHRYNLVEILRNSNITPIRCRGGIGYACCYCAQEYTDPADLKAHTLNEHEENERLRLLDGKDLYKFHAKLDITELKCKICETKINTLEQFIDHLINNHHISLHKDIKNQLFPFKFDQEALRCCICDGVFHKFKSLLEHMNVHYRNYVCKDCDAGFVNRSNLTQHAKRHQLGTFNCDFCSKVFDTFRKKRSHEKCVHTHSHSLNKCGYCNEKFRDYSRKEKHLIDVHGVINKETKCQACDKTFKNQKEYNSHIKRLHLMDKRHKCSECDMAFYTSGELKNHAVKHTGERSFVCDVCHKAYGRQKTLKEHMRIHKDDRRFKCEHCGKAFVQKCGWRGHMWAKHGGKKSRTTLTSQRDSENDKNDPPKAKHGHELEKHRTNIREIILWSNATPIRNRGGIGYACCFCPNQFPDPAELKSHTIAAHDDITKSTFMKGKDMYSYFVKLDITYLTCKICLQSFDTLETLMEHLKCEHNKNISTDINNHILPFKFDSEPLRCFICLNVFNKFKALQEHMHTHYRNFICDVCDAGFVNRHILLCHREAHKLGTFNCKQCTEVFDTMRKLKQHERKIHHGFNMPYKCGYCDERFKESFHKYEHLAKVHGIVGPSVKCQACERTFTTQQTLLLHTKKYHLMQKQHKCSYCDKAFFGKRELNDHIVKHTGTREYRCEVCFKCYGRSKTLKEHIRRLHSDDRRHN
ncbi:unnamed protein product [Pieris macdunnoughi]|uniref:C2H2-type domain-containing protein n=1 Tax=Pieris macdunnoughi TaxID=345717 RepID=A0A821UF31_9NEOP|nr:unnamed protein product [Pieris macdunnoughi]